MGCHHSARSGHWATPLMVVSFVVSLTFSHLLTWVFRTPSPLSFVRSACSVDPSPVPRSCRCDSADKSKVKAVGFVISRLMFVANLAKVDVRRRSRLSMDTSDHSPPEVTPPLHVVNPSSQLADGSVVSPPGVTLNLPDWIDLGLYFRGLRRSPLRTVRSEGGMRADEA
jgi:hypothetical protein